MANKTGRTEGAGEEGVGEIPEKGKSYPACIPARNEAGFRDFGTDSAANYPLVWRSGLVLQETATNGLLE